MYSIAPGKPGLTASTQALTLSAIQGLNYWFAHGRLCLNQAIEGAEKVDCPPPGESAQFGTLRVFGPYLNLEKIASLYQQLGAHLMLGTGVFLTREYAPFGVCAEITIGEKPAEDVQAALESVATALQIELVLCVDSPKLTQPGLLLMDMDSTVIAVECIDEIAKLAGCGEQVAEVTELAMQGKLAFSDSLKNRVACLEQAPESILAQVRDALPLMNGLQNLLETLKQHQWKLAIASGGFTYFAEYLQDRLGLDYMTANELVIKDGQLAGTVSGEIVDAQVKADTLTMLADKWSIPTSQTVALGDGANDLLMLGKAALGVAYHAKPVVRQQAKASIRFGGLDGLLWMLDAS